MFAIQTKTYLFILNMTIGTLQLSAVGDQDRFLIGNPSMTFFRSQYNRYTNFAREWVRVDYQGQARCGSLMPFEIQKSGDLVSKVYLKLTGPIFTVSDTDSNNRTSSEQTAFKGSYVPYLGLERVQCVIGGQVIDEMFGDYMQLWSELVQRNVDDETDTLASMLHSTQTTSSAPNTEETIYLPLPFWFTQNPGLALPIISLISQKLELRIQFPDFHLTTDSKYTLRDNIWESAQLLVEYTFLDEAERRHFAQDKLEYLITTHQRRTQMVQGSENSRSLDLDFFHPVRWFGWGMGAVHNNSTGLSPAFSPLQLVTGALYDTARITINNSDRESAKDSKFYSYIVPYSSRGRNGNRVWGNSYSNLLGTLQDESYTTLNSGSAVTAFGNTYKTLPSIYSFSLDITQPVQPMGALNFSRLDSATLELRGLFRNLPSAIRSDFNTNIIVVAESYNVLRFQGGMAGLAYQS